MDYENESTVLEDFEYWMSRIERKLAMVIKKPTTRIEANRILDSTKSLKEECLTRVLPEELLDEDLYEEDPKISDLVDRYNVLVSALSDNTEKAETLCACWDKLDNDVSELTQAINSGGPGKLTEEELDESLSQLREMFKERTSLIQKLTPAGGSSMMNAEQFRR